TAIARPHVNSRGMVADSTYAVVPFQYGPGVPDAADVTNRVYDGIGRWSGIRLVNQSKLRELSRDNPTGTLTAAVRLAKTAGASDFVWGQVEVQNDSLRVAIGLYDVTGTQLAERTVLLPRDL